MENKILSFVKRKKIAGVSQMIGEFGVSRQYLHRFLQELVRTKKIIKIGQGPIVKYVLNNAENIKKEQEILAKKPYILKLKKPFAGEDYTWKKSFDEYINFFSPSKNTDKILAFAFTEMLNNAIDHSQSKKIEITVEKIGNNIITTIYDYGIGAFANVAKKFGLPTEFDAIPFILKGKQTTNPKQHSGQGIFFTSKIVDEFILQSHGLKLNINNTKDKYAVEKQKNVLGTSISFVVNTHSKKNIGRIFGKFTDKEFVFDKTEIKIKMYELQTDFVSRSVAKRLLIGLDEFSTILLDFEGVDFIGQGFADEIFRIWQNKHPQIKFICENTSKDVLFMINRARHSG